MEAEDPRRVAARDLHHAVDELLARGRVRHVLHALEKRVELGARIVRAVRARAVGARLRAVQKKKEVLGIRVVGAPAQAVHLLRSLADLFLEAIPVGLAHLELDRELLELLAPPVKARFVAGPARSRVEIEHERRAGLRIPALGIAGLSKKLLSLVEGATGLAAVAPDVGNRVKRLTALARAEDAGR